MQVTGPQIQNTFTYHAPKGDQPQRYEKIRSAAAVFANMLAELCPDSRELSIAYTKLQEAVMFANASIAINE